VRGAHLHHLHLHCEVLLQVLRDVFNFTLEKELEFLLDIGSFDFVFLLAFLRLLIRLSLPMEECVNCVQDVSSGWRVHFEECFLQLILELLSFNKHSLDGLHQLPLKHVEERENDFFAAPVFFNPLGVSKHFQVFVILKIKFLVDAGLCEIVFLFQCFRFK